MLRSKVMFETNINTCSNFDNLIISQSGINQLQLYCQQTAFQNKFSQRHLNKSKSQSKFQRQIKATQFDNY